MRYKVQSGTVPSSILLLTESGQSSLHAFRALNADGCTISFNDYRALLLSPYGSPAAWGENTFGCNWGYESVLAGLEDAWGFRYAYAHPGSASIDHGRDSVAITRAFTSAERPFVIRFPQSFAAKWLAPITMLRKSVVDSAVETAEIVESLFPVKLELF